MAVSVKFAGAISGSAVARSSVGSGVPLGDSVSVAAVLGVAVAAISVELAVGDGPTAVNSRRSFDRVARMAVSVKFAGAISGPAVAKSSVGSGVTLARTSIGGSSVSVSTPVGVFVATISVGLAVGDRSATVNSRRSSIEARMAVSVKFAGAISGFAVASISVGSGVVLGSSVSVAAVLGVAVATKSVGLAVGDKCQQQSTPGARRLRRGWRSVSNSPARFLVPPSRGLPSEAASRSASHRRRRLCLCRGCARRCCRGDICRTCRRRQVPAAVNSRRSSSVARMAVSVKFAGAISAVAVASISVGSGVPLGDSVSVATVLGVAVAAISVELAVGDKSAAVNCPALVDRGADGGQCQIRRRDFLDPPSRGLPSEAASRSADSVNSVAAVLGVFVATISVGLAVGDGTATVNSRRSSIVARMAVSVKFAGAISGTRRREDFRRKRRRARRLCFCRGCARRCCRGDICRTCRRRRVCSSQLPALVERGADGGQCQIRWRDFWTRRREDFRRKRRRARRLCFCRGYAWRCCRGDICRTGRR